MNSLLQLLTDTFRIFLDIIPRVYKVNADEMGILFAIWDGIKILKPGVYIYVPLIHDTKKANVMNRSVNLNRLSLTTKDGIQIMAMANINYSIIDIKKAIFDNNEIGQLINAEVSNTICQIITESNIDWIHDKLDHYFSSDKSTKYEAEYWIKIKKVNIIDIWTCFHLNNIDNKDYNRWNSI